MKHILFNNVDSLQLGAPSVDTFAEVTENKIAAFNADNLSTGPIDLSGSETTASNIIIVQGGSGTNVAFQTPILARKNIERIKTTSYSVPVKQSTTIALSGISVSVGEEYTVKVVDVTNGYEPYPVQTVSYTAKTGDNASAVAAGLRAAFTNHPRSLVEVSGATTNVILTGAFPSLQTQEGISITSSPLAQSFSTSLSESLAGATFTPTPTAPLFGTGTYNHVRYLEENSQAGQGFLYRMTPFQAEKPVFYSDPALTYDLVSILYRTNTTPNIAKSNKYVEYILAYNTAANLATNWETVLGF